MSLTLSLHKTCDHCHHSELCLDWNYTYNVSPMWYHIFPNHVSMIPIEGLTGAESLPILEHAIECMEEDPETFIAMDPPNGWGSAHRFLQAIRRLEYAARENPDAIWSACR